MRLKRKLLSVIMTAAMITTLFAGMTVGASAATTITTASQLAAMTTSGDYVLGADITIDASTWTPIGTSASPFTGTFNGGGYTVTWDGDQLTGSSYYAIFGASSGTIENLKVDGSFTITGSNLDYISPVVGYNNGGTIRNVTNEASLDASNSYNVGGIVGFNGTAAITGGVSVGKIFHCANNADITGKSKVGGIAGENAGFISSCSNTGVITSTNGGKDGTGGIAGRNGNNNTATETGIIKNCYNRGSITDSNGKWVGGIVGFQNSLSSITNAYNTGTITGVSYKNAIVGKNENSSGVTYCYATSSSQSGNSSNLAIEKGTTNDSMTNSSFVTTLNNQDGIDADVWQADSSNVNGGYPIFTTNVNESDSATHAATTTGNVPATIETDGIVVGRSGDVSLDTAILNAVSNGKTIYVAGTIDLASGTYGDSLTVVTIKRSRTFTDYLFTVSSGATVTLQNMIIDGNKANVSGSNLIRTYGGTLTLASTVTLQNSLIGANGGAIHVQGGTVNSEATISDCEARNGGGVYISGGTFNMTDGEIYSCVANINGGGLYKGSNGTFSNNGGDISDNQPNDIVLIP